MDLLQKRIWAEISLDNIEHNYRQIRSKMPADCMFMGVVKANAYGHGAVRVAQLLKELGADYLGVACFDEAEELRRHTSLPIMVLGCTPAECTESLIGMNITQTVNSLSSAQEFSKRAEAAGKKLKIHLKVDTGMGRLGLNSRGLNDPIPEILAIEALPGLDIEGIFTHFAVSDVKNDPFTRAQFDIFSHLIQKLDKEYNVKFQIRHCANSGALINCDYAVTQMNMVRPGIALYGMYPGEDKGGLDLRPAMELKTRIVQLGDFERGATVSYGRTWKAGENRKIAVLPIGYADGFFRAFSNNRDVLIRGRRAPITGRVCMDLTMADVTDTPNVEVGDIVTIFGHDGKSFIPVEECANAVHTISYELICAVSARVPRGYYRNGERV